MTIEIKDYDLQDILKAVVKEEIQFLAKALLARPEIRQLLWTYTREQFETTLLADCGLPEGLVKAFDTQNKLEPEGGCVSSLF